MLSPGQWVYEPGRSTLQIAAAGPSIRTGFLRAFLVRRAERLISRALWERLANERARATRWRWPPESLMRACVFAETESSLNQA